MAAKPDLTEFFKHSQPKRKPCMVPFALAQLPDEEQGQLKAALATDQGIITNVAIEKWLSSREIRVGWQTIRSHRIGVCTCRDD